MTDEELATQDRFERQEAQRVSEEAFVKLKRTKAGKVWTAKWDAFIAAHTDDREYLDRVKRDERYMALYWAAFQAPDAKVKLKAIQEFLAYAEKVPDGEITTVMQEETVKAEGIVGESKAVVVAQAQAHQGKEVLEFVTQMRVHTTDDYEVAVRIVVETKAQRKEWDAARTSITKPMNEALRNTNDLFRPALQACDDIERTLKAKIVAFQERQAAERQRQLDVIAAAKTADDAAVALVKADQTLVPKVDGLSMRYDWTGEVTDVAALPREFMMPDWDKLLAVTKAAKADPKIPGWRGFQKSIPVVKTYRGSEADPDGDGIPF